MNILRHANCCRRLLTTLRVVCVIASATLLDSHCRSTAAQAQLPNNPRTTAESRKASPSRPGDPQSAENLAKQLLKLKDRLLQLSQGEQNETTKAEIAEILEAITIAGARAEAMQLTEKKPEQVAHAQQLKQLQEQFAAQQKQLAEREKQFATALAEQRRPPLPPLENGTVKIYRFAYADSRTAAQTVESLFGTQSVRVSVDDRNNLLIAYGKPETITALDALLSRFDEQASPNGYTKSTSGTASPRSLMLRVFWLADNMPESVGQNPSDFLPKSVLEATRKLGLTAPRLVTQTVNSLATGKDDAVDFSTTVPAVLFDQPVSMDCGGKLKLVADDRVRVEMRVQIGGQPTVCDLKGSMATPLGHYMVLGTANSMIAEGGPMAGGVPGAPGMAMGRAPMGPGGGFRQPGFGSGGPEGGGAPGAGAASAGAVAPGAVGPAGEFAGPGAEPNAGPGGATVAPSAKQKYETSRFAFVVQVIEGQSYGAEKAKPEGE